MNAFSISLPMICRRLECGLLRLPWSLRERTGKPRAEGARRHNLCFMNSEISSKGSTFSSAAGGAGSTSSTGPRKSP